MIVLRSWVMADAVTAMAGIIAVAGSSRIWRNAVIPSKCEVLQRQLPVRANRGPQCPKEDPKPSDHDRSDSLTDPRNASKSGRMSF
jgi:hypothetical protein